MPGNPTLCHPVFHCKRLGNVLELFLIILHLASRTAWLGDVKGTGGKEKSQAGIGVGKASPSNALTQPCGSDR